MAKTFNPIMTLPEIGTAQIELLEKLSNASGVSGDETAIRRIVRDELSGIADELTVDVMGNLIAIKKAKTENAPRVMIAAHMDEVGFMLNHKESDGIFRFATVGGIDPRALAGKAVRIGKNGVPGVIGACPIHLSPRSELENILTLNSLRIDVSPEVSEVEVGEYAVFATQFKRLGEISLLGKAFDNRIGVATLIELVKNAPENVELIAAFTVQEEVGLRGAKAVAYRMNPDAAFVIDCTPANDQPAYDGSENVAYKSKLDEGPAIYVMDGRTLYDRRLVRYFSDLGDSYGIRYQYRQPQPGGTDAGPIHLTKEGIPTLSLSVPGRYAHTAAMVIRIADWQGYYQLLAVALRHFSLDLISGERE